MLEADIVKMIGLGVGRCDWVGRVGGKEVTWPPQIKSDTVGFDLRVEQHFSWDVSRLSVMAGVLRPRFSKNNHFPQKQAAAKVFHCYAILTLFAEFRL
jgi:hypothetical protein